MSTDAIFKTYLLKATRTVDLRFKKIYIVIGQAKIFGLPASLSTPFGMVGTTSGSTRIMVYSLVSFALFCLVKQIIEYFAKKLSEQKVPITDVVGLYSTYQKYIMIGAPNSYQFREKWT